MSIEAASRVSLMSRRVGAWLQLLALLPAAVVWGGAGLGYAVLIVSGVAGQFWRAPQAWLVTTLFVGAGLGLVALLSALWPVAAGVRSVYRLARWQGVGLLVGAVVAVWGLATMGFKTPPQQTVLALLQFGLPLLVAATVGITTCRERGSS
jgi:energy-converting hydrogenase Eha subunit G